MGMMSISSDVAIVDPTESGSLFRRASPHSADSPSRFGTAVDGELARPVGRVVPRPKTGARRIVVLGSYAPSLINFRGPLIAALIAQGHIVHALAPDIDDATHAKLRALGAIPCSVHLRNSGIDPVANLRTLAELTRLFREISPDCVLSYTIKPVTLGSLAARRARVGQIVALVTGLGYAFTSGPGWRRRLSRIAAKLLYQWAFAACDLILFQNPDDEADLRRLGLVRDGDETHQVHGSGVDLAHYAPAPLSDQPRFLMISRLLGDKGVREYAAAAARLKMAYPQAEFALLGYIDQGPDSISPGELAAFERMGVRYLGPSEDVRPAIASCNVFVLPSYREGTPRSVLEAMAMGRPVVTTDVPGCRQAVIHGVNGLLVPPRDAGALADAMRSFVERPEQIAPMGAASLSRAQTLFDVDLVNAEIVAAMALAR
jgi:glycosyltransferase involved in cell wall biosynthesis